MPTSVCCFPTGGPQLGSRSPLYQQLHPLLPPTPSWGVYPSSCYKGSILTNIRKNQGKATGRVSQGMEETSKIWKPLVPQMGEEERTLWRRSAPRFPAPTRHSFVGGASLASSLSHLQLPVTNCLRLVPSWGNGNCAAPCPRSPCPSAVKAITHYIKHSFLGPQPLSAEPPLHPHPITFGPRLTQRRRQRAQVVCLLALEGQVAGSPTGKTRRKPGGEGPIGGEGAWGSTLLHWGGAAVQGAYSLRCQLDFHVIGMGVKASSSLIPCPSEKRCLEFSIRRDQETSSHRQGSSGSEAGHRLQ